MRRVVRLAALLLGSLVLAGLSVLVVAPAPAYDAWSWLLWGREVASGTLSTAEGPAFKPLAVAVTTVLSVLGDGAPVAWVVLARAASVVAVVLAGVLATELAGGRRAAGALAAAGVALCGAYATYAASGDVTGLLLALALGGVLAWRRGRIGVALGCAVGCTLLRVETWPFALALGVVLWPRLRPALVAAAVLVPAAWFVPEWLGSGDPLRSGARARVPNPGQPALADVPALASLAGAAGLVLVPLLVAAVLARGAALRLVLAGLAWVALVAAMAQAGFSGEARYALPGAALVAVGGAVALVRVPLVLAVALVAVAAAPRLLALDELAAQQAHQWRLASDLPDAVDAAGGRDAVLRCGTPYTGRLRGPMVAWRLGVEKRRVEPDAPPAPPGVVFRSRWRPSSDVAPDAAAFAGDAVQVGRWEVRSRCAPLR